MSMTHKVTFGRIIDVFNNAKKQYSYLNEETRISWVIFVDESNYEMLKSLKVNVSLGSILFGIEWNDDEGYLCKGSLYIEPEPTNEILN